MLPQPTLHSDPAPALSELGEPVIALLRKVAIEELMPRFKRVAIEKKHDGSVVTEADRAVEAALIAALPKIFDCPVLGEEMPEVEQKRLWREADWLWCVDPLDGTANFTSGKRYFGGRAKHPSIDVRARDEGRRARQIVGDGTRGL